MQQNYGAAPAQDAPFQKQSKEVAAAANSMMDMVERGQISANAFAAALPDFMKGTSDEATLTRMAEHAQRLASASQAQTGLAGLIPEQMFEQGAM